MKGMTCAEVSPLFVVEELGEWRIEVYDDGAMKFIDHVEDVAEITFGV